ncbi:hypothetical protein PoB_000224300 [Plakobranchus ocellatus]|uniref:Uncharacterized protein n=1 Tax=Plakobranchus ocellatus TaxID=259542 RepID=A0AAV3XZD3_9GAST|nr:hypothetical protein PoB_000224300 [Plakobranchus ocellatus]
MSVPELIASRSKKVKQTTMNYRYTALYGGSVRAEKEEDVLVHSNNTITNPYLRFIQKLCTGRRPPPTRKVFVDNKPLPGEEISEYYQYPDNKVVSSKVNINRSTSLCRT